MDQVDLTIPRGIYGLLGENGGGKTTLMRVLTTVLTPKEGEIWLDHIRYEPQQYETIKRKLGLYLQELNLYPDFPGERMSGISGRTLPNSEEYL